LPSSCPRERVDKGGSSGIRNPTDSRVPNPESRIPQDRYADGSPPRSGSVSPMGILNGRGAVVTGGGRGIGAETARVLAQHGASVVVTARSTDEIEAVAAELRDSGARALAIACDVADE